ncbi:cytochrome c [Duganella sp. 1224]|uniref:cache domain-containing protein n=1 Tax=Duganella sp. 1224 TaxID=2587052 RepID=UPI0015CAC442|nr:cache domain-containing protein [Duganella sp. 1224]NYE62507.1 cytochrome c [Duganella sp. 1224]
MKAWVAAAALGLAWGLALCGGGAAAAAQKGSRAEAVAMVKRAVAMVKAQGRDKAFAAISDPANTDFHDRDLYVYVYDFNGKVLAHGNNPQMVGTPRIALKDMEGKFMIQEMITLAKTRGGGWISYKWPNPVTKTVELKEGYIERVDDFLIGSGAYR